jgi:autoinducer 2 (AI-2) kinase
VSPTWLVGLDLGGESLRCAFLDVDSGALTVAARRFRGRPDPDVPAGARFDPEATWSLLAEAVREAGRRAGATPDGIRGIACSSMRHASVLVDASGAVLLATTNRDARGAGAMLGLGAEDGEAFLARTGRWPHPILPAGRLQWLAAERPDLLDATVAHLSASDWVASRLCGERATDPSQAGETLVFDLATRAWAPDLMGRLSLPEAIFPTVREPGSRLGSLRPEIAQELDLPPDLPVAVGGADTQCALLGAGATQPGRMVVVAGSTVPIQQIVDRPLVDARLWGGQSLHPGRFVLESNAGGVGEALAWLAPVLFDDAPHPLLHLLDAAAHASPGASGLLSTFGVQVMDARAPELPLGQLTLSPFCAQEEADRRPALTRAVCEGVSHGLLANAEQIAEHSGQIPEVVDIVGGLSRSGFFTQLLADVWRREVRVSENVEATALGAALCAGVGAGVFADLDEAATRCAREGRRHAPDSEGVAVYGDLHTTWRALWNAEAEPRRAAMLHALRHLSDPASSKASTEALPRPRILVASDMDERGLEALRTLGDVEYASFRDMGRLLTGDPLAEALRGFQVFVTEIDLVNAEGLAGCHDLRAIVVCRGDAVNVDLPACTTLGIPVMHTPGRNADAVADLTLGFLLALSRKLVPANAFLREPGGEAGDLGRMGRAFVGFQGRELWRKTVGLVGLGAVGRRVLTRLRGFGVRSLVYDPFLSDDAIRLQGAEPASLDDLLAASDFVSLHAPVTDDTRGLIGERALGVMKEGACLINTARAALLDEEALAAALGSGHLGGAALDVFAVEPPASSHPLLAFENVIATPHVGGNTTDVAAHQGEIVAAELGRLCRSQRPRHLLNPETFAAFSWSEPRPPPPAGWLERHAAGAGPEVTDLRCDAKGSGKG